MRGEVYLHYHCVGLETQQWLCTRISSQIGIGQTFDLANETGYAVQICEGLD